MKRGSRDSRFAVMKTFYSTFKAGHMPEEIVKQNLEFAGFSIYESELEKVPAEFPDIDVNDFRAFLEKFGVLKLKKAPSEGKGGGKLSLNTLEKAKAVGVLDENIEKYLEIVNKMFDLRKELQPIVPHGTVTITIPNREKKEEEGTA